jgi:hypothetical protein
VLVRSDPRDIPRIVSLSRATYRKMVQTLWWAAGYNILAMDREVHDPARGSSRSRLPTGFRELPAEVAHVDIEGVGLDVGILAPDRGDRSHAADLPPPLVRRRPSHLRGLTRDLTAETELARERLTGRSSIRSGGECSMVSTASVDSASTASGTPLARESGGAPGTSTQGSLRRAFGVVTSVPAPMAMPMSAVASGAAPPRAAETGHPT